VHAETALGHPPFTLPDGSLASHLEDSLSHRRAVLICGGPSFGSVDHSLIRDSGLLSMTLNNGVMTFRSDLWLGVDSPGRFDRTIWKDSGITKFVPIKYSSHRRVRKGANIVLYQRSPPWCTEQVFAPGNTIDWSNGRGSGYRTSMIDAIRVLFLLGLRTVYLFGADFHQSRDYGYHHPAPGYRRKITGNNRIYGNLSKRFALMRPVLEAAGLRIYNCNKDSHLDAFEKCDFTARLAAEAGAARSLDKSP
jgi:hypothetical protein